MGRPVTEHDPFVWEDPPPTTALEGRWFPPEARTELDAHPGKWARVARNAGQHIPGELRQAFPDYEIVTRRSDPGTGPRRYTIYARRRAES